MINKDLLKIRLNDIIAELNNYRSFYEKNCPEYLEELDDSIKELYNARQGLFVTKD